MRKHACPDTFNEPYFIASHRTSCIPAKPALGSRQLHDQLQVQKVFAQHSTFGIKLEIDKKFLDYAYKSAETVANGSAESGASSEAEMQAAKMAAAVKEQAEAKRAAEDKAKAKAMAKAKAKASEKEERRLLAEAAAEAKVAKAVAAKAAAAAEAEVKRLKAAKRLPDTAKEEDGAATAAEVAEATLVQVRCPLLSAMLLIYTSSTQKRNART